MEPSADLVSYSHEQGKCVLEKRGVTTLKEYGHFLTPPTVARYMAEQLGVFKNGDALLEPACGSGVLVCAVIERLIAEKNPLEVWVNAYETDKELADLCRQIFEIASQKAGKYKIKRLSGSCRGRAANVGQIANLSYGVAK